MQLNPPRLTNNLWAHVADSARLPVIREDSHPTALATELIEPVKVPSYNEPKPIILHKTDGKSKTSNPNHSSSSSSASATCKASFPPATDNPLIDSSGTKIGLQETDLDSFSQHMYGAINKSAECCKFFFDSSSSTNIKAKLLEEKISQSPALSSRTAFSIADTTKATIQSEESLDNLLEEFKPTRSCQQDDSPIYNISSNSSQSSAVYGHIIKKNYANECIENDFYKNRSKRKKCSNQQQYFDSVVSSGNSKDDYCVFIRRDSGDPVSRDSSFSRKNRKHSKHHHEPSSYAARHHHRHYQAHNSPLIVHRFYHIDNEANLTKRASFSSQNMTTFNQPSTSSRKLKREDAKFPLLYPIGTKPNQPSSDSDSDDDWNSAAAAVMGGSRYRVAQRLLERSSSGPRRKGSLPDYYKSRAAAPIPPPPQFAASRKKLSSLESMVVDSSEQQIDRKSTPPQSIFSIESKGRQLFGESGVSECAQKIVNPFMASSSRMARNDGPKALLDDNANDLIQLETFKVAESDDSSYYAEDENEDNHNNNNNNEDFQDESTKAASGTTRLENAALESLDNCLTDFENGELNSLFAECPDNRSVDFDVDFGHRSIPLLSTECLTSDEEEMSSKTTSSIHDHTTTDGGSEFLYDSDGQSLNPDRLLQQLSRKVIVTDLDQQISMLLSGDGWRTQPESGRENFEIYDSNMNRSMESGSLLLDDTRSIDQSTCDNLLNNNELEV